ncbi:pantetheine-phosphate adenylyltransferase [Parabacteroides sp. FAFU027]|uniref:pantetheine-phosphate adenylyltransferase n=1 Tax=Parabacteroides sp. FAFU027 TaxID=2922715 RepID=UPI001FAFA4E7|nr:pantetheine-phosphate adenylyltransferase [Parabacteroides sp. FAFU027]
MPKKIAVFPGTFDPFTTGHEALVRRGLTFLDEIIIAIGVNESKKTWQSLDERLKTISRIYADEPRVKVIPYDGLTIDFAVEHNAKIILRGIRSTTDLEYEKLMADVNRKVSGIETVLLITEPEFAHISSSVVRELQRYGKDISQFLP